MEHSLTATYGEAWQCGNAEQEARYLLPLLRAAGQTVADVLDLIRVPPEEKKLLHAFAEKFPEFKFKVERSLDYRLRVEKEFCRLAGDVGLAATALAPQNQIESKPAIETEEAQLEEATEPNGRHGPSVAYGRK